MSFWLFMIMMVVVVQGLPIWFAARAKPIGGMPYRWGTYVALITAYVAISMALIRFPGFETTPQFNILYALALAAFAIATTIGLFRRQKFGVVTFVVTYILLISAVPAMDVIYHQPPGPPAPQSFLVVVFVIVSLIYFKKRWKFMSPSKVASLVGN